MNIRTILGILEFMLFFCPPPLWPCPTLADSIPTPLDAPLAGSKAACTTLANFLLKAHVLNVSDKEKSLGCLRRQDKLSN